MVREVVSAPSEAVQLPLGAGAYSEVIDELKAIDVNVLTPIESMSLLFDIVNRLKNI